jgi:methionyl aminopeptidase
MIPLKKAKEIKIMKEGGRRLALVMREALLLVKPGLSLSDLDQEIEKLILKNGGQPSFKTVPDYHWASCLNINQGVVHGVPNDYRLQKNDLLSIDIGFLWQGFHNDMARTLNVGEGNAKLRKFLTVGKETLKKAIQAAKVGNRIGHLSAAIEKGLKDAGYSPVEILTGHGVGRKLHEEPQIPCLLWKSLKNTPEIKSGMVLAIEVIYAQGSPDLVLGNDNWTIETKDGQLSGLFEDTVLVESGKTEVLTKLN